MKRTVSLEHALMGLVAVAAALLLVVPVPTAVLDLAYAASLTFSVALIAAVLAAPTQASLSWYPRVVVLMALTRVSLTVAATRLVLTRGDAGHVVRGLGQAVAGANVVIGLVVLALLIVVQLVVVGRGAERVAEVAARFSLDALPGAQMSLDGDVRSGALDPVAARRARDQLLYASRLSGALDGASRFVRGDAVASILLLVTSLGGGVVIGVMQRGLGADEAFTRFGLLTVGEGIGAQIPALLGSVATGLLVTRADDPRAVAKPVASGAAALVAGAFALVLSVVPGLPALPFVVVGVACVAFGASRPRVTDEGVDRWSLEAPPKTGAPVVAEIDAALRGRGLPIGPPRLLPAAGGAFRLVVRGLVAATSDDPRVIVDAAVRQAPALFGIEATTAWLDAARRTTPTLVDTAVPSRVSPARLAFLLSDLASDAIPLSCHEEILEACVRAAPCPDDGPFVERVRRHLSASISAAVAPSLRVEAIGVDRAMLGELREAERKGRLSETVRRELSSQLRQIVDGTIEPPVVIVPADVRRRVRDALRPDVEGVRVVGLEELAPSVEVAIAHELGPMGRP